MHNIPQKLYRLYDGMTAAQLHQSIIQEDAQSLLALWFLLSVRMGETLKSCFISHFGVMAESARQWEDYLDDFYMYVYEYSPANANKEEHFYLLRKLENNTKVEGLLYQTFKNYLAGELEQIKKFIDRKDDIKNEEIFKSLNETEVNMLRICYTLILFFQRLDSINRYILFRTLGHRMLEDNDALSNPSDEVIANILNLTYGTYRTRSSRLLADVRQQMKALSSQDLAEIAPEHKVKVHAILHYETDLDEELEELFKQSEQSLPEEMLSLIRDNRHLSASYQKELSVKMGSCIYNLDIFDCLVEPCARVEDSSFSNFHQISLSHSEENPLLHYRKQRLASFVRHFHQLLTEA